MSARDAVREFRKMLNEAGVRTGVVDAMLDEYEAGLPAAWSFSRNHDTVMIAHPDGCEALNVCEIGSTKAVRMFNRMCEALQ